jgi:hypothetical protein
MTIFSLCWPMPGIDHIRLDALKQKHAESLDRSEHAIGSNPAIYREIKSLLDRILSEPLDVSEYYGTARRLAELVKCLNPANADTIFPYYLSNIDPNRNGDVRYFRYICRDLAQQLRMLDNRRIEKCKLRLVK